MRATIAYYLRNERGISMAEIARNVGVGTSAIAMAIKDLILKRKSDNFEQRS